MSVDSVLNLFAASISKLKVCHLVAQSCWHDLKKSNNICLSKYVLCLKVWAFLCKKELPAAADECATSSFHTVASPLSCISSLPHSTESFPHIKPVHNTQEEHLWKTCWLILPVRFHLCLCTRVKQSQCWPTGDIIWRVWRCVMSLWLHTNKNPKTQFMLYTKQPLLAKTVTFPLFLCAFEMFVRNSASYLHHMLLWVNPGHYRLQV